MTGAGRRRKNCQSAETSQPLIDLRCTNPKQLHNHPKQLANWLSRLRKSLRDDRVLAPSASLTLRGVRQPARRAVQEQLVGVPGAEGENIDGHRACCYAEGFESACAHSTASTRSASGMESAAGAVHQPAGPSASCRLSTAAATLFFEETAFTSAAQAREVMTQ